MAKLKTLLICMVVLVLVTSSLAEQQNSNHKKQGRKKGEVLTKSKKKPQADAPLPSRKKCMSDNHLQFSLKIFYLLVGNCE